MKSPCSGICRVNGNQCIGCMRTMDEIGLWSSFSLQDKQRIYDELPHRRLKCTGMFYVKDQMNKPVKLKGPLDRVVSLVPSVTQTLIDMGLSHKLVGITSYCPVPEFNPEITVLGGTKNPKIKKIKDLEADIIIGNKEENRREDIEALRGRYPVWMSDNNTIEESQDFFKSMLELFGFPEQGMRRYKSIEKLTPKVKNTLSEASYLYFIWKDPWMVAANDTFISSLIDFCGGKNAVSHLQRYPSVDIEQLKDSPPDLIFLPDEPFKFTRTEKEHLETLFPTSKILLVEGDSFCWPGSGLLKGLEFFSEFPTAFR